MSPVQHKRHLYFRAHALAREFLFYNPARNNYSWIFIVQCPSSKCSSFTPLTQINQSKL